MEIFSRLNLGLKSNTSFPFCICTGFPVIEKTVLAFGIALISANVKLIANRSPIPLSVMSFTESILIGKPDDSFGGLLRLMANFLTEKYLGLLCNTNP